VNIYLQITLVSAIIGVVANLLIVLLILSQKGSDKASWYLVIWIIAMTLGLQVLGYYVMIQTQPEHALFWYRMTYPLGIFMPFIYLFVKYYLKEKLSNLSKYFLSIYFIISVLFIWTSNEFILGVVWNDSVGFYLAEFSFLKAKAIVFYVGIFYWMYTIYLLFKFTKKQKSSIVINRLRFLIAGLIVPLIGFTSITLPIIELRKYPLDMWFHTLGSIIIAYGILRYRLMNITLIIRKGLIYSVTTIFITSIYLIFTFIIQTIITGESAKISIPAAISTAIIIAVIFQPLQNFTQKIIDSIFFRKSYSVQDLLEKLTVGITQSIKLDGISNFVLQSIIDTIQIRNGQILLLNTETQNFEVKYSYKCVINPNKQLSLLLPELNNIIINNKTVSRYDKEVENAQEIFQRFDCEIIVPVITTERPVGLLVLGSKLSAEPYSLEEYQLLSIISRQVATALQNALLFRQEVIDKQKIEELLRHEQELSEMKSQFITIASHSLRTPLTAIKGYYEYLSENNKIFTLEDQQNINYIDTSINKLSNLIEQILTVSSIEKGVVSIYKTNSNLVELVNQAFEAHLHEAESKQIELINKVTENLQNLMIDKMKILQVFDNLLNNAIKFTDKGTVTIDIEDRPVEVIVKIIDTGVGIPKEEIPKIFTSFYKLQPKLLAIEGIGIGLYVSKLIIEAHGGRMKVFSKVGVGSTFEFSLPK